MNETPAVLLARHTRWPERLQHALAADPGSRGWLAGNRHLRTGPAETLAGHADADALLTLVEEGHPGLVGLPAYLRRAQQLQLADDEASRNLCRRVDRLAARALTTGYGDAATAATVAVLEHGWVPGMWTAEVLLAVATDTGLDLPVGSALAAADQSTRALWLTTPAGSTVTDEDAWELLQRRDTDFPGEPCYPLVESLALVLTLRPGLAGRVDPDGPEALAAAGAVLAWVHGQPGVAELDSSAPWARWRARRALFTDHGRELRQTGRPEVWVVHPGAVLLAHLVGRGGWSGTQRATLLELIRDRFAEDLGHLAPTLAASLGGKAVVSPDSSLTLTREAVRRRQSGPRLAAASPPGQSLPRPDALSLAVAALTEDRAPAVGAHLVRALADADPAVEAARWGVALRLAEGFAGTVAELAQVATQLAPAR